MHGSQPRVNQSYWAPKLARTVERDQANTTSLEDAGWTVIRIWEHVPVFEAFERVRVALERGN